MNINYKNVNKLCSFYVSDWHLITMLLPYIDKQVEEETKVATILENSIEDKITTFIKKLKIPNEEKILKINWNNKKLTKYTYIKRTIESNLGKTNLFIVNGTKEYIKQANECIDRYIQNNYEKLNKTNTIIKIVDCYKIVEFNDNIIEILDNHDKILNTSGEKEITDIFEDYVRNKKIS